MIRFRPRPGGIRRKMLFAFLPAALLMAGSGILFFSIASQYASQTQSIFRPATQLDTLIRTLDTATASLEGYLETRHFDRLNTYIQAASDLRQTIRLLDPGPSHDPAELLLHNITRLIGAYLESTDKAMGAKRSRDIPGYVAAYQESQRIARVIETYTNNYNRELLRTNSASHLALSDWIARTQFILLAVIALVTLLDFAFLVRMTGLVIRPLESLARSADNFDPDRFEPRFTPVDTGDEIGVLSRAYANMIDRLEAYFRDAQDKARLQELLKDAQMRALQAQINPHFIFNTLNAGMQLAMFENAERSAALMDNLSRLLRYNLRNLDRPVTLRDELDVCRSYVAILKTRFGDMLDYREIIDPDTLDIPMPGLVIQPLIENAWMHGLAEKPDGGTITIEAWPIDGGAEVVIRDDGLGLPLDSRPETESKSTGIGMGNVRSRLELFYGSPSGPDLTSEGGKGTRASFRIFWHNRERKPQ